MPIDEKKVSRDTLYLAIFTTVTILMWIGFEVVRSLTQSKQALIEQKKLVPVPANLDQAVLENIRQRVVFEEDQLKELATPAPVTESGKRASIELTPAPQATSGAGL